MCIRDRVYIVLAAVISSVSTSIGIAALGKAFSSETEHEAEVATADLEKNSNDYVGDADLASFQGKWYGSNLDEYGNASASDLSGMELNISFIDGKGYANLNSNTNYFDSVFYEQTYQGDKLLPIKKVDDNKWQVAFNEKAESGQKLSVAPVSYTHLDVYKRQPNIIIEDGVIEAIGMYYGAGIGGGNNAKTGGQTISITGGEIKAYGGSGEGIGTGAGGTIQNISISGEPLITAYSCLLYTSYPL